MTKFKDVAHLYLGCEMIALFDVEQTGYEDLTFEKGDIGKLSLVNIGSAQIYCNEVDAYPFVTSFESEFACHYDFNEFKPILRPLSDMTEEELNECGNMDYDFSNDPELNQHKWQDFETLLSPKQFLYLLKQCFDLFDLIHNGEAIDKTTLNK